MAVSRENDLNQRATTPCCSFFKTCCGTFNVFENPRLNHTVDTCVVDIRRHLNEPCQPDWPTYGELERRCRLGGGGSVATGIVTSGCDTTIGLFGPLASRDCGLHSETAIQDWPTCTKGLGGGTSQQNLDVVHSQTVRTGCQKKYSRNPTQMAEHTILVGCLRERVPVLDCDGPVQWTQTGKRTMREPRRTHFVKTGLNACLTSRAPIPPLIRSKIHHHMGSITTHSTRHLWATQDVTCWHGART